MKMNGFKHHNGRLPVETPHITIKVFPAPRGVRIEMKHEPPTTFDQTQPCPTYIGVANVMRKFGEGDPNTIIDAFKSVQSRMSAETRRHLWKQVMEGYCERCAGPAPCECNGRVILPFTGV